MPEFGIQTNYRTSRACVQAGKSPTHKSLNKNFNDPNAPTDCESHEDNTVLRLPLIRRQSGWTLLGGFHRGSTELIMLHISLSNRVSGQGCVSALRAEFSTRIEQTPSYCVAMCAMYQIVFIVIL